MLPDGFRFGRLRRDRTSPAVLAGFALVAFVSLGVRLLVEPGSSYLGFGTDPKIFIWCFGWWPYAILHGQNPFVSHAIWAPSGVNLVWAASIPGLALLFAPLTLLVGPVVSYNVAMVLLPALAAWTGFLLCRHLTREVWPSLVGGYLFGFSSYVLGQTEGHPHIAAVFLVPLIALVIVRFVEGELAGRGLVIRLGPLLGLELLISTEVAFTIAIAIVIGLVLGWALLPAQRPRLVGLLAPLAGASLFAALLTAPFVYYALTGFQSGAFHPPTDYVTDLLNFAVPTKLAVASLGWANPIADRFPGNNAERDAYLGVPVLLIVGLFVWRRARAPAGRFLLVTLVVAVVCSLGARLTVDGRQIISLPWAIVGKWPLFDNVLPERLALYVSLVTAVMVALWTAARPPGLLRWGLPALAVLAILPNPDAGAWRTQYTVPRFFTDSAYRACLEPDENILPLPVSSRSESMLWQAVSGYRFRMAGGYIAPLPPASFLRPAAVARVIDGYGLPPRKAAVLAAFIRAKNVTSVVVDAREAPLWEGALDRIAAPQRVGGVILYRISDRSPVCPGA